jgi:hypothetical protein
VPVIRLTVTRFTVHAFHFVVGNQGHKFHGSHVSRSQVSRVKITRFTVTSFTVARFLPRSHVSLGSWELVRVSFHCHKFHVSRSHVSRSQVSRSHVSFHGHTFHLVVGNWYGFPSTVTRFTVTCFTVTCSTVTQRGGGSGYDGGG